MRTTIDIPDDLYRELKSRAASEGGTIKQLILRGVKKTLESKRADAPKGRRLKFPLIDSKRPGTLHLDNKTIYDLIDFP